VALFTGCCQAADLLLTESVSQLQPVLGGSKHAICVQKNAWGVGKGASLQSEKLNVVWQCAHTA
jgi:hypothetical protein